MVSQAGLDALRFLRSEDQTEVVAMQAVAKAAEDERDRREHNLAVAIATQVGKLFS